MRTLALLGTVLLLTGGLPAPAQAAPAGAASGGEPPIVEVVLNDPTVEFVDEAEATAELTEAGFGVENLSEDGSEITAELTSVLGDGAAVATELSVDLVTQEATATLVSESADVDDTTLIAEIHEFTEDVIDITVTDAATGESERISTATGTGAMVPLVLGIPLVIAALEALIAASTAMIIAGVTYVALTKAIEAISKRGSTYQHFVAVRVTGKPLMIGNGLSFSSAVSRVKAKADVWSRSSNGASTVCKSASGGRGLLPSEKDKSGGYKVWHFHTTPKNGAHCFYGSY